MSNIITLAPIVLFVYNRPGHTQHTLEALQKNELSSESELFVYSDAPKNDAVKASVVEVRELIRNIIGFKKVTVIERDKNWGLAASIIDGVTAVINQYGKIIVLEDDLLTSPYFLQYMNDALRLYEKSEKVMHISGSTYPVKDFCNESSYFLNLPLCWGWATWERAWKNFSKDTHIVDQFDRKMISIFNFDNTYNYWDQLKSNRIGKLNTWFIFWYATLFLEDSLSLFPQKSFVKNIGMDGTGVNCGKTSDFDIDIATSYIKLKTIPLIKSEEAFAEHKVYFHSIRPKFYYNLIRKISRIFRA